MASRMPSIFFLQRIARRRDADKTVRPVAALPHGEIDLKRVAPFGDRNIERPQRAAAVQAEQAANVLRAALQGCMFG